MAETIRKSTFEKDFIERTYSSVVSDVTIAFSELVANSWDAGATTVNITLPSKANEKIIIEDNGSGMTDDEFQERWMVIAYNRVAHQGQYIEYTSLQGKAKRLAYVYTYAQLVQTASKRLFNLKNKLIERYQEMNAKDYISEILNEPKQTELVLL